MLKKIMRVENPETARRIMSFFLYGILLGYIIMLLSAVFSSGGVRSLNLVPLAELVGWLQDGSREAILAFRFKVMAHTIMFIPLGVYLMLLRRDKRISKTMLWILLSSLSIGIIQFTFALGISDINKVILNCLGGLIGVLAYKLATKVFKGDENVRSVVAKVSTIVGLPVLILFIILTLVNL